MGSELAGPSITIVFHSPLSAKHRERIVDLLLQNQHRAAEGMIDNRPLPRDEGDFRFDKRPLIFSFGAELEGRNPESIDQWYSGVMPFGSNIAAQLRLGAMSNQFEDHTALANVALLVLSEFEGSVHIGHHHDLESLAAEFGDGRVCNIAGTGTFINRPFLVHWKNNPHFRFIK